MTQAAVDGFAALLRVPIAAARARLQLARAARDYPGIRAVGLRLRYLLEMAEEHGIGPDQDEPAGETRPGAGGR